MLQLLSFKYLATGSRIGKGGLRLANLWRWDTLQAAIGALLALGRIAIRSRFARLFLYN